METELKEIYIVTSGEYSDYDICAAFTDKELAEKYAKTFNNRYDEHRVETYPLNIFSKELKEGYKPYFLRMTKEGVCTEIEIKDNSYGFDSENLQYGFDIQMNLHISIMAKDEQHAIKIANEKRVQLIANNKWVR